MDALVLLLYMAAFGGLIWMLVVRPQRKRQREMQTMLAGLKAGDEVVTVGGLYGTVTEIEDDETLLLEVAENTEMRFARGAIGRVLTAKEPAPEAPGEPAGEAPAT